MKFKGLKLRGKKAPAAEPSGNRVRPSWIKYALLGLLLYLVFLIIELPASWLSWGLTHFSQGTVVISHPQGTLWNGKGELIISYPRSRHHAIGDTEWRINPLWLVTGKVKIAVRVLGEQVQARTRLALGPGKYVIEQTVATLPAAFVATVYSPASLFGPEGALRIESDSLALDETGITGSATARWLGAASSLTPVRPLGDYQLALTGKGGSVALKLSTLKGDLELAGQGQWNITKGGLINFNGSARPRGRSGDLEPLLKLIGNDLGGGRRLLRLNARLLFPLARP